MLNIKDIYRRSYKCEKSIHIYIDFYESFHVHSVLVGGLIDKGLLI